MTDNEIGSIRQCIDATLARLLLPIVEKLKNRLDLPPQEWFSIKETAAITGLSADHVRRHVVAGLLSAANQGSFEKPLYLIHKPDIDKWMEERKERPSPAPRKRRQPEPGSYASRHHKAKLPAA
jgi:hypothetical protein